MQKPLYLDTDELLDGDLDVGGRGNDLWRLCESAYTGDAKTVKELIDHDPNLATYEYITSPLGFAVAAGNTEVAKTLLSHGASPCASLREHSFLQIAEIRGYSEIRQLLLDALNSRFNYSEYQHALTELFHAIAALDANRIGELLKAQPQLGTGATLSGDTAMHHAASLSNGNVKDVVDLLLRHGARLDARNGDGQTPIDAAMEGGKTKLVRYFLEKHPVDHITVLAFEGDLDRVEASLKADPSQANALNPGGQRPLSLAAKGGHLAIVKALLEAGAQIEAPERKARHGMALAEAVTGNHYEVAELLLEHGANPNHQPLTLHAHDDKMVALLLRYGSYVSFWDRCGGDDIEIVSSMLNMNPAMARCEAPILLGRSRGDNPLTTGGKHLKVIRLLLRYGAQPRPTSNWCNSYMWNDYDKARLLLDHGASPDMGTMTGVRPLHFLATEVWGDHSLGVAELLLERGAEVDLVEELSGATPLGWASSCGDIELMKLLMTHGADVNPPTQPWGTPLALAEQNEKTDAIMLLKRHSAKP